ncbi:MAG: carbamoyltransferase HypF [Gemmatimonadota bacterium]|nr:carbamoyltransferase HypF [Gemmatimonadota bacterium]
MERAEQASGQHAGGLRLRVSGVVQGVGFRPFVHRLAARHGLRGWVRNTTGDVEIAVAGEPLELERFFAALSAEAPPLARIDRVERSACDPAPLGAFRIVESDAAGVEGQWVSPDVATCAACEAELFDPANRRYGYPFITCTDCGPRYTVIERMPYDRERTSMRAFTQCPACRREYETLGDRRYHSETNGCPVCGPRLVLVNAAGAVMPDAPISGAGAVLRRGGVVAVRGVGGFHLAVDATNDAAVERLRRGKHRDGKPLAVMVRSLDEARRLAAVSPDEAEWLGRPSRPIVVLRRRRGARVAPSVCGALDTIGLMLPYTPVHLLLLDAVGRPLVMTSGNHAGEPLAASLAEARRDLAGVADAFLTHDREIVARLDDSVLRVAPGRRAGEPARPILMRRARGFAPLPVALPVATPAPLVAVGPHLKNTFTIAAGRDAYLSPHLGDLETLETTDHWQAVYASYKRLFRVEPQTVVRDLHPQYLSTRLAEELGLGEAMVVQHHHAHIAAVAAEHGVTDRVVGVAFDGTGYGDDGRTWGAELLVADLLDYRRVGQLRYVPLPGGDAGARSPWRVALGWLSLEPALAPAFALAFRDVDPRAVELVRSQVAHDVNAPLVSSMGRLFDAAAAVLGVCGESRFEGEAAMRLEAAAGRNAAPPLLYEGRAGQAGTYVFDPLPLLAALGERAQAGEAVGPLAAAFHESVAAGTADAVGRIAEQHGVRLVALGGGVFQNARLLVTLAARLERAGLRVLAPRQLSPNDGAVSYGQAAIAAARLARR